MVESRWVNRVEDLEVFRLAFDISIEIHKATLIFPKIEQYAIADQLRRASKAICSNLAEGFCKQSHSIAEFKRFLSMAIGSSDETRIWIRYVYALGYIDQSTYARWVDNYVRISKMLQSLRNNTKAKKPISDYRLPIASHA